ncbi:MAG: 5-oxoprolinase subunit PxpB [Pyrinomonadaceae bacterium]|nr:5-oxoprolinase subunit PxpB [Pyrinomonadaceae bacterium]
MDRDASHRIFPLGDSALTVEFGNVISPELNQKAIALANCIENSPFPGLIETVPAYTTTTIFYDLVEVRRSFSEFPTAFEAVNRIASDMVAGLDESPPDDSRLVEISVIFDRESEFDLGHVANEHGLSIDQVIDIFTSTAYRLYMLGFLPGFSYMGEVDERIATPRKETPRTLVPKGSIGIAGKQTGIYSLASPGGWQIIGRTEVEMFTPNNDSPTYLDAGDEVRFIEAK